MYSIIDIETTGGNPFKDKITEIAVYVHDGVKVVKEFHTLINPERKIPYFISRMTGITDEMVAGAPRFFEVAKKLVEITENTVFVAHNVTFDYNFIKAEFKNLGYYYQRESLCPVKLSKKIIPGKKSYSLGKLCQELGINITDRHRAHGDALATVKLFELLFNCNAGQIIAETLDMKLNNTLLHQAITRQTIENLPQKTGIYYFLDEKGVIIYIGKSKDIKQRVLTHLSQVKSKKSDDMVGRIADIQFEVTGSELLALLRESEEIKYHKPEFNTAHKKSIYSFGLFSYYDENGYICLKIDKTINGHLPHTSFASEQQGKDFLFVLTEKYNLCQNLTGLLITRSGCFRYAVKQCNGACVGEETPGSYNQRVMEALEFASFTKDNMIILDQGRTPSEASFIIMEQGKYLGYGYTPRDEMLTSVDDFKNLLTPGWDNKDAHQIISGFLRNKRTGKRIIY